MSSFGTAARLVALMAATVAPACGTDDGAAMTGDDVADVADTAADVTVDAAIDVATDVDAAPDVTADVPPDVAADVPPDVAVDVVPDVAADVAVDTSTDTPPDVPLDAVADIMGDVAADVALDVPLDAITDAAPFACDPTSTSDLDGVSLVFTSEQCAFTRAELAAGVTFTWQVEATQPVQNVLPRALDAGRCGRPDDSGLIPFFRIDGAATYCLCDEGLCFPFGEAADLVAGTWTGEATWTGRAWFGPSDTGNPLGDPFAPGDYTASVVAEGSRTIGEDGPEIPFRLASEMTIRVLP